MCVFGGCVAFTRHRRQICNMYAAPSFDPHKHATARHAQREMNIHTAYSRMTSAQPYGHTDRQTDRQTDAGTQTGGQAGIYIHTERQAVKYVFMSWDDLNMKNAMSSIRCSSTLHHH
jgi:hypothetical protein